jgi:hypothetical protein
VAAVDNASLLRAWGEKVLIALVLKLLADKLMRLMDLALVPQGKGAIAAALAPRLVTLRNDVAAFAVPARVVPATPFVNQAIALWSRSMSIFRRGTLPGNAEAYEVLCSARPNLMPADPNIVESGLGKFGIAMALLQNGRAVGLWELRGPLTNELSAGAMTARALRPDGKHRPIFSSGRRRKPLRSKVREHSPMTMRSSSMETMSGIS